MVKTQTDLHWNWTSIEVINTPLPLHSYRNRVTRRDPCS